MSKSILVAYATGHGSTKEVAETIGKTLLENNSEVTVQLANEVKTVSKYDAIIIGAPKLFFWHPVAMKFLKRFRNELKKKTVGLFITSIDLYKDTEALPSELEVHCDTTHLMKPAGRTNPGLKQKARSATKYILPIIKKVPEIKFASIALFAGKVDPEASPLLIRIIQKHLLKMKTLDKRNFSFIKEWSMEFSKKLK